MAANSNEKATSLTAKMVRHLAGGETYQAASKRTRAQWPGRSPLELDVPISRATELMEAAGIGSDALYATKAPWSTKTFKAICKVYGVDPDGSCGKALRALDTAAFDREFDNALSSSAQGYNSDADTTSSVALAWKAPATRDIIGRLLKVKALVEAHGQSNGVMTLAMDTVKFEDLLAPSGDPSPATTLRCVRIPGQRPEWKDCDLAVVEFPRPESWNEGTLPWPLSLDLYLGQCRNTGLYIKAATISFEMSGAACIDQYRDRTAWPGGMDVLQPNGRAMPKRFRLMPKGPTQSPSYELTYGKAPLGGLTAHHIIRVHNAVAGDRVTVRLQIAIADLADVIRGGDEQL